LSQSDDATARELVASVIATNPELARVLATDPDLGDLVEEP
jgi:hypothetical protein